MLVNVPRRFFRRRFQETTSQIDESTRGVYHTCMAKKLRVGKLSGKTPAERLRSARLERAWTQPELAARLEVEPNTVYRWERQGMDFTVRNDAIAAVLGVPPAWLRYGVN